MILVDTSAWIHFFRDMRPVADVVERLLEDNQVALCGPIITEILRGFKSEKERNLVAPLLSGCRLLVQPDQLWEDAGNCGFMLRRQGKTVKSMVLLIACYAMAHSASIFTLDRDFQLIKNAGFDITIMSA